MLRVLGESSTPACRHARVTQLAVRFAEGLALPIAQK
jgi:hypothetical protein